MMSFKPCSVSWCGKSSSRSIEIVKGSRVFYSLCLNHIIELKNRQKQTEKILDSGDLK